MLAIATVCLSADIWLLDLARVQSRCRSLYYRRRCGGLVGRYTTKSCLCETLERGWVSSSLGCDVWIVNDEGVDVVVRDDIRDDLLVFFASSNGSPPLRL